LIADVKSQVLQVLARYYILHYITLENYL